MVQGLLWLDVVVDRHCLGNHCAGMTEIRRKHNRIAYAGTAKVPQGILDLVSSLQSALSAAGFAFDRQAYVPHITLVRKARCPAPSIELRTGLPELTQPIVWPVREWVLVKSGQANGRSGYHPIGRWPLAG